MEKKTLDAVSLPSPYLKILAHSTSRMASPSSPPTPYAIALFVVSRRDMVASVRRVSDVVAEISAASGDAAQSGTLQFKAGVDAASRELPDVAVTWTGPTQDQVEKQIDLIQRLIPTKPHLIAVAPNDAVLADTSA